MHACMLARAQPHLYNRLQAGSHTGYNVCGGCWHRAHNGERPALAPLDARTTALLDLIMTGEDWIEYMSCSPDEAEGLLDGLQRFASTLPDVPPYDRPSIESLGAVRVHSMAACAAGINCMSHRTRLSRAHH